MSEPRPVKVSTGRSASTVVAVVISKGLTRRLAPGGGSPQLVFIAAGEAPAHFGGGASSPLASLLFR